MLIAVLLGVTNPTLREGEVSEGKTAVEAEGVVIQIPPAFKETARKGAVMAFAGKFEGMLGAVDGVIYVTKEAFKGSLASWVAKQKKAALGKKATLQDDMPAKAFDDAGVNRDAHQFWAVSEKTRHLARWTVSKGFAYGVHCEIAADVQSYASAGSNCVVAAGTLHVR